MKKEQFFGFLKAPFSKSFIISYLFSCFFLLSVSLLSNIISLLLKNINVLKGVSEKEAASTFLTLLKNNLDVLDLFWSGLGIFIGGILVSSYALLLTHKTVIAKKGIFSAERISLNFSEILFAIPKLFGWMIIKVISVIPFVIFFLVGIPAITGAEKISVVLELIVVFLFFVGLFYLLYKWLCYLFTFSIIFYKEFKLSSFFNYKKVNTFFVTKKKNIFIAWLLFFVTNQIAYTIYASIGGNILEKIVLAGGILETLNLSNITPIIIGFLVWNFVFVYLTLLQAIVLGKIVLWVEKSKK